MLFGHKHHPGGGTVLDADVCMNGSLVSLDDLAPSYRQGKLPHQAQFEALGHIHPRCGGKLCLSRS